VAGDDALAAASADPDDAPLEADSDLRYARETIVRLITQETAVHPSDSAASAVPVKPMLLLKAAAT
jgi:hypothetical protein